ncbi:Mavicyanin-like protein [Drosera capensis]
MPHHNPLLTLYSTLSRCHFSFDTITKVRCQPVFNYDSSIHNVLVVDQNDYTNCVSSNAIQTYSNGKTSIALTQSGPVYFICGFPGHCSGGMQLQINVQASSSSSGGSSTTPSTPSTTPASTTPTTTTTTTGSSGTAATSNINGLIFELSVVLGTLCFQGLVNPISGPETMYSTSPLKKGLEDRSA